MTKLLTLMTAMFCVMSMSAQQKAADKATAQWRYEIQPVAGQATQGAAILRVWSYSKKPTIATSQAGKNAIHGIIFKGYPASNDGTRIVGRDPLIADPMVEEANAAYFENFFKEGGDFQRYVSYRNNGAPDAQQKIGKEYKIAISVVVMVDQLRERLEKDGILTAADEAVEGKMPTLMIVPSKAYCNDHKCMTQIKNNGGTEYIVDYEKALLDNDLNQAIAAIRARLVKRGFEVKDLSRALATLKTESAEESVLMSIDGGAAVQETPIDVLRRTAKADLWVEIGYDIISTKGGSQQAMRFGMEAIDAYTDFSAALIPPTIGKDTYSASKNIALMIESAVEGQFDPFCNSMVEYFKDLAVKGRAIKIRVLVWDDFDGNLMSEYDGDELHEIIEDWLADNTVKGKFGAPDVSPSGTRMTIEQARMPLVNKKGRDNDPVRWIRDLKNMLKNEYGIESNVSSKGLGEVQIVIGSK